MNYYDSEKRKESYRLSFIIFMVALIGMMVMFLIPKVIERENHQDHWHGTVDTTTVVIREPMEK